MEFSNRNYLTKDKIKITTSYSISHVEKLYKKLGDILREKWPETLQIHRSDFHSLDERLFLRLSSKPIFIKGNVIVEYELSHIKNDEDK